MSDKPIREIRHEEFFNVLTHGIGLGLAIPAAAVLIVKGAGAGPPAVRVGFPLFGCGLVLVYLASTLYHAERNERRKAWLRNFDYSSIFVLIAASYTPVALAVLPSPLGPALVTVEWVLAGAGIAVRAAAPRAYGSGMGRLFIAWYLIMGWLVLPAVGPLVRGMEPAAVGSLFGGGILYTAGTILLSSKRLRHGHAYWHLCVIGGSVLHFVLIFGFLDAG